MQQRVAQLEQQAETYLKAAQSAHDGHRAAVKYTADLQADHATLLGLVQEREYEIKRRIWAMHGSRMGHQLYGDDGRLDCNTCFRKYSDESLETVYGFELYDANVLCAKAASLPAQAAQGGACKHPGGMLSENGKCLGCTDAEGETRA